MYSAPEPPPLHANADHQVLRWRHTADRWGAKILPLVVDRERAAEAERRVVWWTWRVANG